MESILYPPRIIRDNIIQFMNDGLKILSCGAGMQTTALALMSCENAIKGPDTHPGVPIYDLIIFCDLGYEPPWVYHQVEFIAAACKRAKINFKVLKTGLYDFYINNFGKKKYMSSMIPFWTLGPDGKAGKMPRQCTLDFKIIKIQNYVREKLLGYTPKQHIRGEDIGRHEMHIGFSSEEKSRVFKSMNKMFVNKYPLDEMGWTRVNCYAYCLEKWRLDTRASACCVCPFHTKHFFWQLQICHRHCFDAVAKMDEVLEQNRKLTIIHSDLFISKARKRVWLLTEDECDDVETLVYGGKIVDIGF